MGVVESIFLFVGLLIGSYFIMKIGERKLLKHKTTEKNETESINHKVLEEELKRRELIIEKIDNFLRQAQFFDPIAKWKGNNVYRYVVNNGVLYEFEDFMLENNQRIGIDDNYLCFKQMTYKRVNDPQDFLETFKLV